MQASPQHATTTLLPADAAKLAGSLRVLRRRALGTPSTHCPEVALPDAAHAPPTRGDAGKRRRARTDARNRCGRQAMQGAAGQGSGGRRPWPDTRFTELRCNGAPAFSTALGTTPCPACFLRRGARWRGAPHKRDSALLPPQARLVLDMFPVTMLRATTDIASVGFPGLSPLPYSLLPLAPYGHRGPRS